MAALSPLSLPSVQEIVDGGILHVPAPFVLPVPLQPRLSDVVSDQREYQIPVIDLSGLLSGGQRRLQTIHDIGRACEEWGFFQVINHGVPASVVDEMKRAYPKFFGQPAEERNRYRRLNFNDPVVYSTSNFTPSLEKTRDWKDTLAVRQCPGVSDGFEQAPQICKRAFQDYRDEMYKLSNLIYQSIFQSLGLSPDSPALPGIPRLCMSVNYYPKCPDPSLTLGLSEHTDGGSLTVLLTEAGFQIKKADKWIAVKPLPNAFVINVGDQIEILTNGKYKSFDHRVPANVDKATYSVTCFFTPTEDTSVAPLSELVSEERPALYNEVVYGEYLKDVSLKDLRPNKASLNFAKATLH